MSRKVLRLQQIAERTGIPVATLRWYRHKGVGGPPTFLLAGRVVAFEDEVDSWIEQQHAATAVGGAA
jgi:predicted DNA-binding transcriptional regulator AlpA